jgi:t-SNARE complex subunit (syntaxin)
MEGGVVDYGHLNGSASKGKKESVLTDPHEEQHQVQIDYEVERKMMLEKNAMLNEVEQATLRINELISDTGMMVEEQGQNLDVISEELINTNKNMTKANEDLEEAGQLQRKSKRKYICLAVLIIVALVAAGGVIFFLVS